ncbi:MAG: diguanylate cyclase, partial [Myxococcota bacterium]
MTRSELPHPSDDGGSDDTTVILRARPAEPEDQVLVVRSAFAVGALSYWVAEPGTWATIGRSTDANLVLPDPSVSRFHARIEADAAGSLHLTDLNSTNGTFINQVPLKGKSVLDPGDRVSIGAVGLLIDRMSRAEVGALQATASKLKEASKDPLTGLVTRRFVSDNLPGWVERHRAQSEPVCCLYVDLDGFKAVNDRSGHAAGDLVLRQVADLVRRAIRDGDVAVRVGGDEVVVFLGKCRQNEALVVAGRLCQA